MRLILLCTVLCLGAVNTVQAAAFGNVNLNLIVGQKLLDDGDWGGDLDQQISYGLMSDINVAVIPFSIALDILTTAESADQAGPDLEGKTFEINAGIRKYFTLVPVVDPYVGAGLSWLQAEIDNGIQTDDGDGFGYWIDAGVVYVIKDHVNVGADVRYSQGDVDLDGGAPEIDAGGLTYSVFVGIHF
jgi:hypothetical protein